MPVLQRSPWRLPQLPTPRSCNPPGSHALQCLKRRNINKYLEAEIVNHSLLRHPHIVQFKVREFKYCIKS